MLASTIRILFLFVILCLLNGGVLANTSKARSAAKSTAIKVSGPPVIFILDSSTTMQQLLGSSTKLSLMRKVLDRYFQNWNLPNPVGIMVYGGDAKKGCNAYRILFSPRRVNPIKIAGLLASLKAAGRSPLSSAVLESAHKFNYLKRSVNLVVITDGRDSCRFDPCILGEELARNDFNLRIYVIGLDIKAKHVEKLQCLAHATGGQYYPVLNQDDLLQALQDISLHIKKPAQAELTMVKLSAAASKHTQPIQKGLQWWLSPLAGGVGPSYRDIEYSTKAEPVWYLTPGKYSVTLQYGTVRLSKVITVKPGLLNHHVITVGNGFLQLDAKTVLDGPILQQGLRWSINKSIGPGGEERINIVSTNKAQPKLELAAGKYQVVVRYGDILQKHSVEIQPGITTKETVLFQASYLKLNAQASGDGKPLQLNLLWVVRKAKPNEKGKQVIVAYRKMASPTFILSPGDYLVSVLWGAASHSELVGLKEGVSLIRSFTLNAGLARIDPRLSDSGPKVSQPLLWRIYDSNNKLIVSDKVIKPFFRLNAGTYQVRVKLLGGTRSQMLNVIAGKEQVMPFVLQAGILQLAAVVGQEQKPVTNVFWHIYQRLDSGELLSMARSYAAKPAFVLLPGTYTVVVKHAGHSAKVSFTLKEGQILSKILRIP